ncbi:hypothetical protein E2C01_073112 [Portunus trituberculatus]|uniref:Uncharacterized protein n=1 Tax=Portunus trituberculatus TaxID=210409 RepID=A0A5B7I1Y9_PORTR|nr:hypothetical protein [Portunus trituberculatus]
MPRKLNSLIQGGFSAMRWVLPLDSSPTSSCVRGRGGLVDSAYASANPKKLYSKNRPSIAVSATCHTGVNGGRLGVRGGGGSGSDDAFDLL